MMIYAHKKFSHQQEVYEWETVRRSILEKAGWYVAEDAAEPVEPFDADPDADLLPDDFPGLVSLLSAGITTFATLRDYPGDLTDLDGIGKATAEKIHAALQ